MRLLRRALVGAIACVGLIGLPAAQAVPDEKVITDLVEDFRLAAVDRTRIERLRPILAEDYVHITPDGTMTTSWRLATPMTPTSAIAIDALHVRAFGDVGVAAYVWRASGQIQPTHVMQVFQRQSRAWRIIATQIGGRRPLLTGPITATDLTPPSAATPAAGEIRATWSRYNDAVNAGSPKGDEFIRSVFAEDAIYVDPNGTPFTREERLGRGHPVGLIVPDHVDLYLATFGNAAVWTSRNPDNLDQSVRVWLKRPAGWQMVAMRHGMSYVKK